MAYHQTTKLTAVQRTIYTIRANSQAKIIYDFMRENPDKEFSAEEIHSVLFNALTPLTSTRRAISDLCLRLGAIRQSEKQVTGQYGRPVSLWYFSSKQEQLKLAL